MAATDSEVSSGSSVVKRGDPNQPAAATARPLPAPPVAAPPVAAPRPGSEESQSGSRRAVGMVTAPFAASVILHVIALLAMALLVTASQSPRQQPLPIVASVSDDELIEDLLEPLEIEAAEEHEFEQPVVDAVIDPGAIAIGDVAVDITTDASDFGGIDAIGSIGDFAGLDLGAGLGGKGDGAGAAAGVTFFGTKSKGNSVVFVVDNSLSMGGGRFETALSELLKAVNALGPKQRFYVIFYSDTAYGMFHPEPASGLLPATDENKERLRGWLYTVERCLRTSGEEAFAKALELNPDIIYILGDGAFTDKTEPLLTAPHSRRTVMHALGMKVDERGERQLQAIATANGGTFRQVDIDRDAVAAAKAAGLTIKNNRTRGSVWGLKLPAPK
jgi:hypothetical protein